MKQCFTENCSKQFSTISPIYTFLIHYITILIIISATLQTCRVSLFSTSSMLISSAMLAKRALKSACTENLPYLLMHVIDLIVNNSSHNSSTTTKQTYKHNIIKIPILFLKIIIIIKKAIRIISLHTLCFYFSSPS